MNLTNDHATSPQPPFKRWVFLMIAIVLGGVVIYFATVPKPPAHAEKVVINQAAKTLLYLPLYIAQQQGFFKAEGIEVSIVTGGGDSQAFAAVLSGSADMGQGDPMMVPISRQRGGPGKIVGNIVGKVAFWGVATDPKIEMISDPKGFSGKRVVTYPRPMTIHALQLRNLKVANLTPGKDSTIVQAQFGAELAPLFSGDADISMTIEPVVSQALARGAHIVYSFPEHYGEFALTGLMIKDEAIQNGSKRLQHILNAYQRALTFAHQNPDAAVDIATKEFPDIDRTVIQSAVRRMLEEETIPRSVVVSLQSYQQAVQVRRDVGDLEREVPFSEAVDNRFAEEAARLYGGK